MNNIDYNKDYYSILGVDKSATESEIHKAFLKLSKKYHPDMQTGKSDDEKKKSEEKFKEVNEANEILSDSSSRAEYDRIREMGGGMPHMGGMGNFGFGDGDDLAAEILRRHGFGMGGMGSGFAYANFNRRQARNPINGRNIHINVSLPFEDFFFGCEKTIDIKVNNKCTHCNKGVIGDNPEYETCPVCHGRGMTITIRGLTTIQQTCDNCGGTGQIISNQCSHCHGTTIDGTRIQTCKFEIPKFSYSGFTKEYVRVGHCGVFGGESGNISVTAQMDYTGRFVLANDYDYETLKTVHVVPILKALIGGTERILTPYGYTDVEIPRCFENPTEIRVKNKGMKRKNSSENADLIVQLHWDIPNDITNKEKEQIQKIIKSMASRDGVYGLIKSMNESDDSYIKRINETFTSVKS